MVSVSQQNHMEPFINHHIYEVWAEDKFIARFSNTRCAARTAVFLNGNVRRLGVPLMDNADCRAVAQ